MADAHVVSVVVPTLGRRTLAEVRAALAGQTRPPDEIAIVVDEERRGASWARNEGLRRTTGDLVAFLDDDCVPEPDWLASLVEAADEWGADGAGGTYAESDPMLEDMRARRPTPGAPCLDPGGLVGIGGNVLYRRDRLEALAREDGHVWNERLGPGEDWELAWRLRRSGASLVFVPATVRHLRRARPWAHLRQQFGRGVSIAQLYLLHRDAGAPVAAQQSRIWGERGSAGAAGLARAAWHKLVGPFERAAFRRRRDFLLFWAGEKVQAAGFAWGMAREWRWKTALKLLVSVAVLALIVRQVSFHAIADALRGADPRLVLLGILPLPLMSWLAALQMRVATELQGLKLPLRRIIEVNLSTAFYGLFLPGVIAGGALRWYQFSSPDGKPLEALAAIVYNRVVETSTALVLGLAFWAADPVARAHPALGAIAALMVLGLLVGQIVIVNPRVAERLVPGPLAERLRPFVAAASRFGALPARGHAEVAGICLARHLLGVVATWLFALALHLDLTMVEVGWVRSLLIIVAIVPLTIGGLGLREGSLIAALAPYGVGSGPAVALGVLIFARDLVGAAAGGVLEGYRLFARTGERRTGERTGERGGGRSGGRTGTQAGGGSTDGPASGTGWGRGRRAEDVVGGQSPEAAAEAGDRRGVTEAARAPAAGGVEQA